MARVDGVGGSDLGEQRRRGARGELSRGSAGDQVAQQPVEPVDGAAPLLVEFVAAVRQQPQNRVMLLRDHTAEIGAMQGDGRDADRVDAVGLTAVAGVEKPGPCGQRRRDIDNGLTGGDESLCEQPTEPVGTLDRPNALRPSTRPVVQPGHLVS